MKAPAIALVLLASANAFNAASCPPPTRPGDPLPGLSAEERERFEKGREVFERAFTPETGLGPLFNADACGECHEQLVAGGGGDETELHVAVRRADVCDLLVEQGGFVIQQHATPALQRALGIESEPIPSEATAHAARRSASVLGFGLLDAVPDAEILARADPDDRNRDGISGRPNRFLDGRLGRFGRKAFVPNLREFNLGAFVIEMGITNPAVPTEESIGGRPIPDGVDPVSDPEISEDEALLANDFVRFLAPPAAEALDAEGERGRLIFGTIGCAGCHVPTLVTGNSPVAALRYRPVAAYTDLLLHDMGSERGDICLGLASPSEFRTAPLMGLRLEEAFLHDGKARTVEEAIELHAGEARATRERFRHLSPVRRAALLRFLAAL